MLTTDYSILLGGWSDHSAYGEPPQQDHWSECGRATSVANTDALGRPHRSVPALATRSAMIAAIKTQKFWLISNLVGIAIFLFVAICTWDLDHGFGGLFPEYAFLHLLLPLFIAFDSIWLLSILFRFRHPKIFQKLALLAIVAAFWTCVVGIDSHMENFWYKQAQKELNDHN